jgi:carbonic anhydrase
MKSTVNMILSRIEVVTAFLVWTMPTFVGGSLLVRKPKVAGRTKEELDALKPEQVLMWLKEGNGRFASGRPKEHDHRGAVKQTAPAQYPMAAILGCMDSRTPSTLVFDQSVGDLFTINVAGNISNEDVLGSLEYACKTIGSKVILVMGHTDCGAVKGAIDGIKLGYMTKLLKKIEPAKIDASSYFQCDCHSRNGAYVKAVAVANVRRTIAEIWQKSEILRELEKNGAIKIAGAMYDVETGIVEFL